MEGNTVSTVIWQILDYIGSAMPLAILCYMLAFISKGKKIKMKTVGAYVVVAVIMFFIMLRTS
jgi:hypothetical protein